MAAKKRKKEPVDESAGFGLNLGALLQVKGVVEESKSSEFNEDAPAERSPDSSGPLELSSQRKLVVRTERKGRKGKTVTVIRGFNAETEQLDVLAKSLRRSLGCGGGVEEGDQIVLQGDILDRVGAWLEKNGAPNVVYGNRTKK